MRTKIYKRVKYFKYNLKVIFFNEKDEAFYYTYQECKPGPFYDLSSSNDLTICYKYNLYDGYIDILFKESEYSK